jgi:hypothetical protein
VTHLAGSITTYPNQGNPFWDEFVLRHLGQPRYRGRRWQRKLDEFAETRPPGKAELRGGFLSRFAHTIPSPLTLGFVYACLGRAYWTKPRAEGGSAIEGVISVGAGNGCWEWLIAQMGYAVAAFDAAPPDTRANEYHARGKLFHPVEVGGPEQAARFPHFALFLAWPPPGSFALDVLESYAGDHLLYMGAWREPEQNASAEFFAALDQHWRITASHEPHHWADAPRDLVVMLQRIS